MPLGCLVGLRQWSFHRNRDKSGKTQTQGAGEPGSRHDIYSCCQSSNVVLLVKLQIIPFSQIGRIVRMERDSLHEIHPSSSSLPDEPDFFPPGRSRLVIDCQESNEFPPWSSALCQIHPWCDSADNNPLAPWMSLFSPLA